MPSKLMEWLEQVELKEVGEELPKSTPQESARAQEAQALFERLKQDPWVWFKVFSDPEKPVRVHDKRQYLMHTYKAPRLEATALHLRILNRRYLI